MILFKKISKTASRIVVGTLLTLCLLQGRSLLAQERFSLQFRPGVSWATTKLGDADLKTGFGFEFTGAYRFMPHVHAYLGWGWNRLQSDESFAGDKTDFEETGYVFGLQFMHPLKDQLPLDYFVRAGVIYNHIEAENADGDIFADSGHGPGFQAEVGVAFTPGPAWKIIPGIKYQTLSRTLTIEEQDFDVELNYLSLGVTIHRKL